MIPIPILYLISAIALCVSAAPGIQATFPEESLNSQHPPKSRYRPLPDLKTQDTFEKQWLKERYARIPGILDKYGYQALLITQREYAEDTLFSSLVSSTTTFSARRRTLMLFHSRNTTELGVENPTVWVDNTPALWPELARTLEILDPERIAVNIDPDLAFSDGLHTGEGRTLFSHLPRKYLARASSERMIPVEIISLRAGGQGQLGMYKMMMENVWAMIEEGFSSSVVVPGVTSADDLEWWFRARMQTMNVTTWFHPSVTIFGPGKSGGLGDDHETYIGPIEHGDMLHVDIGITAMNLNTDTQHLAYVLHPHETSPPAGLVAGLRKANEMQDLVLKWWKVGVAKGKTGNWALRKIRGEMGREGREGKVYCHPIGDHGHSAGTLTGMTNLQEGVPVGGDIPLLKHSWFSVELAAHSFVPEWNITQSFMQEEDVAWSSKTQGWEWVHGRQEHFHLIA